MTHTHLKLLLQGGIVFVGYFGTCASFSYLAGGEGSEGEGNIGTGIGFYSRVDIYNIYTDSWREGRNFN